MLPKSFKRVGRHCLVVEKVVAYRFYISWCSRNPWGDLFLNNYIGAWRTCFLPIIKHLSKESLGVFTATQGVYAGYQSINIVVPATSRFQ